MHTLVPKPLKQTYLRVPMQKVKKETRLSCTQLENKHTHAKATYKHTQIKPQCCDT